MVGLCCTGSSGFPTACSTDSAPGNGCGFAWQESHWRPALFGGKGAPLWSWGRWMEQAVGPAPLRSARFPSCRATWLTIQNFQWGTWQEGRKLSENMEIISLGLLQATFLSTSSGTSLGDESQTKGPNTGIIGNSQALIFLVLL